MHQKQYLHEIISLFLICLFSNFFFVIFKKVPTIFQNWGKGCIFYFINNSFNSIMPPQGNQSRAQGLPRMMETLRAFGTSREMYEDQPVCCFLTLFGFMLKGCHVELSRVNRAAFSSMCLTKGCQNRKESLR